MLVDVEDDSIGNGTMNMSVHHRIAFGCQVVVIEITFIFIVELFPSLIGWHNCQIAGVLAVDVPIMTQQAVGQMEYGVKIHGLSVNNVTGYALFGVEFIDVVTA